MLDIVEIPEDGRDIGIQDSAVPKAANVLSVQLGSLEYAPTFGVDLDYFLQSGLQFQNESFKGYLVQRLTESQVKVAEVETMIEKLYQENTISVAAADEDTSGGLIK